MILQFCTGLKRPGQHVSDWSQAYTSPLSIQGATLAEATLRASTVCEKARQAVHSWVLPAGLLVGSLVVHFCILMLHDCESRAGTPPPLPVVTLRQTAAQEAPAIIAPTY